MNWVAARFTMLRYGVALIFAGLLSVFGTQRLWKQVVKFNKDWHNELTKV